MRAKILDLIEKKGDLPAFPDILTKLQKILDTPYAGVADVTRLIKMDPVLAGNILKISNSAYYKSGYEKIETLQTSVNKLGLEKIRQLAFSLKITKMFSHNKLIDSFEFWKHSLAVANFTEMLSQYTKVSQENRSIARLAGLMHDIGIMVFCYIIPDEYSVFLENVNKEEIPLEKQEEKAFGIDHQETGAKFIEKWWQMDKQIVRTVRYHHLPFDGTGEDDTLLSGQ